MRRINRNSAMRIMDTNDGKGSAGSGIQQFARRVGENLNLGIGLAVVVRNASTIVPNELVVHP